MTDHTKGLLNEMLLLSSLDSSRSAWMIRLNFQRQEDHRWAKSACYHFISYFRILLITFLLHSHVIKSDNEISKFSYKDMECPRQTQTWSESSRGELKNQHWSEKSSSILKICFPNQPCPVIHWVKGPTKCHDFQSHAGIREPLLDLIGIRSWELFEERLGLAFYVHSKFLPGFMGFTCNIGKNFDCYG